MSPEESHTQVTKTRGHSYIKNKVDMFSIIILSWSEMH